MRDDINDLTSREILHGRKTELRAIDSQVTLTEFNSTIGIRDTVFLHFSW